MKYNHKRLSLLFQNATDCTQIKADEHAQKYLTACLTQILRHLNKDADERVYVGFQDIRNQLGDVIVKGQRHYVFTTFQSFPERILVPIELGNDIRGLLTMAELNYGLEELLIAQGDSQELFKELYRDFNDDIQHDDVDYIPIDMFSLESFIKGNLNQDRSNSNVAKRVNHYLYHAIRIKLIAQASNDLGCGYVMPHIISESVFGRKYYKGPNLQNTPKIVRHAALGTCYEYDIESSVFAWKYSWFKSICREANDHVPMPATLEYLDHKSALRKRLAKDVFGSSEDGYVTIIKEAITAIGFGAPARVTGYMSNGSYEPTALNTIITAKTRLQAFLNDAWVQEFVDEQKRINKIMIEYQLVLGMRKHFETIPELLDRGGKLKTNSIISYLYQQTERSILEFLIRQCEDRELLLTVHDCIYTRKPINMLEAREGLKQFGEFFDISREQHQGFAYDSDLIEHRERIAAEEERARQHALANDRPYNKPGHKKITVTREFNSDGAAWDGSGWDGSGYENYQVSEDPFLDEMTEEERSEYRQVRLEILDKTNQHPQWVQDLIAANRH